jgi:hypothetical protein
MYDKRGMDVPTFRDGVAASSSHFCARWSPCSAELIAELRVAPKLICTDYTTARQLCSCTQHSKRGLLGVSGVQMNLAITTYGIVRVCAWTFFRHKLHIKAPRAQAADQRFGGGSSLHTWSDDVRM